MLRLGVVPYLNAQPLYCSYSDRVIAFPPALLAQKLQQGEVDTALVPLAECLLHPDYILVDDVAIGCNGPVQSVLLATAQPLSQITSIALDHESKTSVLLTRVLLEYFHQQHPRYLAEHEPADAHLWIGDRALHFRQQHPNAPYHDLGLAWKNQTHLPFVFAVWAMRPEVASLELAETLRKLKQEGLAQRHLIAETPTQLDYLTHSIQYDLGAAQKKAIQCFAEALLSLNVLSKLPTLTWL